MSFDFFKDVGGNTVGDINSNPNGNVGIKNHRSLPNPVNVPNSKITHETNFTTVPDFNGLVGKLNFNKYF